MRFMHYYLALLFANDIALFVIIIIIIIKRSISKYCFPMGKKDLFAGE